MVEVGFILYVWEQHVLIVIDIFVDTASTYSSQVRVVVPALAGRGRVCLVEEAGIN